jgi:YVTN family beta-propeller protein
MKIKFAHHLLLLLTLCAIVCTVFLTCRKDKGKIASGYPEEIANLLITKCATAGCHTQASKEGAAGLSLETWDDLFKGDRNGAVCIPYQHSYSTLFLFTNTHSTLGAINVPTMPINKPALSADEMQTLIHWINNGAPNIDGKIMWADNPTRKKMYVANQGCDVVTVFDAATQLQMRYINVGTSPSIENPHSLKVSHDGKYWYVVFSASGSTYLEKYSTADDKFIGKANISPGSWNTLTLSNNNKYAYAVDWNPAGKFAIINLDTLYKVVPMGGFQEPHGSAINAKGTTLYLTSQTGNFFYKIPLNDPSSYDQIVLNPPNPPVSTKSYDPHEIAFSPDSLHYYVTCQGKNEVKVYDASNDKLVATLPTGTYPLEMAFSKKKPYLFVTCEYDLTPPEKNRGAVTVINYQSNTFVKNLRTNLAEPHGIAVDDENGLVYVTNRNISGASIPHHTNNCGGTNGFISFIDLTTLEVIKNKKTEVAKDPYAISLRE